MSQCEQVDAIHLVSIILRQCFFATEPFIQSVTEPFIQSDLDMHELLTELWHVTNMRGVRLLHRLASNDKQLSDNVAHAVKVGSVDYLLWKPMKINFKDPSHVDFYLYDREAGEGQFMEVVNRLRNN